MRSGRQELVREDEPAGRETAVASAAPPTPGELSPTAVMALQRSAGNQAVARLVAERTLQRLGEGDMVVDAGGAGGGEQSRKRKREDDDKGGADAPPEKAIKRETVGAYTKDADRPKLDRWTHSTGKWHFSYFKDSGDYHLKGNSGTAKAFQKGFFGGAFETNTENAYKKASAPVIADGTAQYQFCVNNIVPLYAQTPTYKGQTY